MEAGPSSKRRKGSAQRLQSSRNEAVVEGVLYPLLMTHLAQGLLSGVTCGKIAQAAVSDINVAVEGADLASLKKLASISHLRHVAYRVDKQMRTDSDLPPPYHVDMQYSNGAEQKAAILLPHEYFAAMYENKDRWRHSVLPDAGYLQRFWETFQNHPCMIGHPARSKRGWQNFSIPLMLYGDEVPVAGIGKVWSRSALVICWLSLLANAAGANTEDVIQYIWGVFEKFAVDQTMETFWQIMLWSFTALGKGEWPEADWKHIV